MLICSVTFPTIRQQTFTNLKYSLSGKCILRFKHTCIHPQKDTNMITQSRLQKGINDQHGIPTSKNHGYDEGGGNMISLLIGV